MENPLLLHLLHCLTFLDPFWHRVTLAMRSLATHGSEGVRKSERRLTQKLGVNLCKADLATEHLVGETSYRFWFDHLQHL